MQSTAISCSKERCPGATEKLVQKQGGKKVEQSSEIRKTERAEENKEKTPTGNTNPVPSSQGGKKKKKRGLELPNVKTIRRNYKDFKQQYDTSFWQSQGFPTVSPSLPINPSYPPCTHRID